MASALRRRTVALSTPSPDFSLVRIKKLLLDLLIRARLRRDQRPSSSPGGSATCIPWTVARGLPQNPRANLAPHHQDLARGRDFGFPALPASSITGQSPHAPAVPA